MSRRPARSCRCSKAIRATRARRIDVVDAKLCKSPKGLVYLLTLLAHDGEVTRVAVDAASGKAHGRRLTRRASNLRLLVVEDDPDLNRQLVTALTDAGYVVDTRLRRRGRPFPRRHRTL